jgi:hypothetical protein
MGLARKIVLTPEGRAHPMYDGKPTVFDAFTSHEDEVTHIPQASVILAGNEWTRIQVWVFGPDFACVLSSQRVNVVLRPRASRTRVVCAGAFSTIQSMTCTSWHG